MKRCLNCDFCDLVMAVIKGVCAADRRSLLTGLNSKLQAIGYANSADLHEIQMEKTIAIAIRSVDLDPTSPNPSLVRRGMIIENVGEACLPQYESGKGFPSHSVVPIAFTE